MQCEFSKAELIRMDLAIMDRLMKAKAKLADAELTSEARDNKLLEANVDQLEALHNKLDGLIAFLDKYPA